MTYATDSLTAPATEPTFLISYLLTSDGHEGGGFRLKLFAGGQEEGGGVFPVEAYQDEMISDPEARRRGCRMGVPRQARAHAYAQARAGTEG